MILYILTFLSGLLSGTALGLTGGGGSILAVPLLVYLVGENVHLAIITSLIAVGVTSLFSSFSYMKQSFVKFKIAFLMASPGIVSTYFGSLINREIKGPVLLLAFSLLMIVIGFMMWKKKEDRTQINLPQIESSKTFQIDYIKILLLGLLTGFASGFFGIGGGFLLVPALFIGAKLEMKEAIGTSLFIIFLFGIFGLISYKAQGRELNLFVSVIFIAGGTLGGLLGAILAKKLNQERLKKIFAFFTILMGLGILLINVIKIFY